MSNEIQKKPEGGSSEMDGYRIEARSLRGFIDTVEGQQFCREWKTVQLSHTPFGVPSDYSGRYLLYSDCLSMEQALALAWEFKAKAVAQGHYGLRVRLVKYKVKQTWSVEAVGEVLELPDRHDVEFTKVELVEPVIEP